jgi:homoserine dehydrogenase
VSVVSDILDVARSFVAGVSGLSTRGMNAGTRRLRPAFDTVTRYYIRFSVRDEPGVMAALAGALGHEQVSIEAMVQDGRAAVKGGAATVVMLTHGAREAAVRRALDGLAGASFMIEPARLVRIEDV